MRKIFSSELDRMVAAAARDVSIELRLKNGASLVNTWGYTYKQENEVIRYSIPTLHNGDYETILAEVALPEKKPSGDFLFAEVNLLYKTLDGQQELIAPEAVSAKVVDTDNPVYSVSDSTVLRSSIMLKIGQALQKIGELYYSTTAGKDRPKDQRMKEALLLTVETKKQVQNAKKMLDEYGFDDEIKIFERYLDILGELNEYNPPQIAKMKENVEITPPTKKRPLSEYMKYMFDEVLLSFPLDKEYSIAVSGFSYTTEKKAKLLDLLNEYALVAMKKVNKLKVVERGKLEEILKEQELQLSGLVDTKRAIEVGKLSAAELMLTGTVIEMPDSLNIFARVINVKTGEIVTVSQVLIPKEEEILNLL
jgi:hypothetical protein